MNGLAAMLLHQRPRPQLPGGLDFSFEKLAGAAKLDATNVHEYVGQEQAPATPRRFSDAYPAAIPFADPLWMEYADARRQSRWGAFVIATPQAESFTGQMELFLQSSPTRVPQYLGRVLYRTDRVGTVQGKIDFDLYAPHPQEVLDPAAQSLAGSLEGVSRPFFVAMCLANCKNVTVEVNPMPSEVQRLARPKRRQFVQYHVLTIDPMRQVLRTEGDSDANGIVKALHICRGHFKSFDEKPLFGKYRGMYWWSPHVRGAAESGIIVKDYKIS